MWYMASDTAQTYLPSCTPSAPRDRYLSRLLSDRGTCVQTTCPRLLRESAAAGTRTPRPFEFDARVRFWGQMSGGGADVLDSDSVAMER